ncbi:MAG: histidine phosphatase family protein [Oscillospiraceae bacterium]|nr:histidine phosphatase family protein [Oscillospiraceae bacterium]
MRLIFVRHGEPDYVNDCLTPNGEEQAKATAERLSGEGLSAVYASPMGRAQQTASYTAEMTGLDIQTLDFMHEIDWGSRDGSVPFEGHPWTLGFLLEREAEKASAIQDWESHPYFRDNICMEYYRMVSEKFDAFLENFGLYRQGAAYLCKRECSDTVALFAHGGSGAVMFAHLLNIPFPTVLAALPYAVCSVSAVEFDSDPGERVVARLSLFNDTRHMAELRQEKIHFEK